MKRVYFIQGVNGGPIKIGTSSNPVMRLAALQGASSEALEILVTVPGDAYLEAALHKELADGRMRGEWFSEDTPGLAELIEALIAPDPSDPTHAEIQRVLALMDAEELAA